MPRAVRFACFALTVIGAACAPTATPANAPEPRLIPGIEVGAKVHHVWFEGSSEAMRLPEDAKMPSPEVAQVSGTWVLIRWPMPPQFASLPESKRWIDFSKVVAWE